MSNWLVIAFLVLLVARVPAQSGPVISEIMASNVVTLADEDGQTSDWIEIYNPKTTAIDLGGWYLTDDNANLTKWAFPKSTNLAAGGFLLVSASAKTRAVSGKQLHTYFSLKSGGEYVGLSDPTDKLVADLGASYPRQYPDLSYGLEFMPKVTTERVYSPGERPDERTVSVPPWSGTSRIGRRR